MPSKTEIFESKKKPAVKTVTERTASQKIADIIYILLRVGIIANVILLFFPSFNPARLSEMIGRNLSLFSCGVSYDSIVANVR